MRRTSFILALLLVATAGPAMPEGYGPIGPRPPIILNGCTESALFAILNSTPGQRCLQFLPRASNVGTDFSLYCSAGRWGCCLKAAGLSSCKIEGLIPTQRRLPPGVLSPG